MVSGREARGKGQRGRNKERQALSKKDMNNFL